MNQTNPLILIKLFDLFSIQSLLIKIVILANDKNMFRKKDLYHIKLFEMAGSLDVICCSTHITRN